MAAAPRAQRAERVPRILMEAASTKPDWTEQELLALAMYPFV
tara:strand:+ start:103 stop:228 length:126 start_codon:yes stop_codon:yes gene_type:complete